MNDVRVLLAIGKIQDERELFKKKKIIEYNLIFRNGFLQAGALIIAVHIGSLLLIYCEITDLRKRVYIGQNLHSQLANDVKEIVLKIVFFLHKN